VNIPLEEALDRCWEMLAECFDPAETGIRRAIIENHWPKDLAETAETSPPEETEQEVETAAAGE